MKTLLRILPLLFAAGLFAGCESTGSVRDDGGAQVIDGQQGAQTEGAGEGAEGGGAQASGVEGAGGFDMQALNDPTSLLSKRTLYFDFDSSKIGETEREIITAHGNFLAASPGLKVILEGHADERGTREYNIGLGERRAQAVRQLLLFLGVQSDQIQTVSFGEEKPAALGHDESAWRLNRRVEIIYEGL
ncbi:MAG: hypothetical protein Kow006_01450 [Gammaproteobacteria bacterium]